MEGGEEKVSSRKEGGGGVGEGERDRLGLRVALPLLIGTGCLLTARMQYLGRRPRMRLMTGGRAGQVGSWCGCGCGCGCGTNLQKVLSFVVISWCLFLVYTCLWVSRAVQVCKKFLFYVLKMAQP